MQVPRIYIDQPLESNQELRLAASASHYLINVLRLKVGRPLLIFNGDGGEFQAKLIAREKKLAILHVGAYLDSDCASPLRIHLVQGLSRGERMDYVVQKAVELGVNSITPIITERCNVKLAADRVSNRLQHWQKVMVSACEQSGRCHLATIHPPCDLSDWLQHQTMSGFIAQPGCEHTITHYINQPLDEVAMLIGPEGGFTQKECEFATANGIQPLGLGQRILRTETATVTALTLLQAQWGDLK
jgi:16S rRNA (uracil1498-N3)-methyltransferase